MNRFYNAGCDPDSSVFDIIDDGASYPDIAPGLGHGLYVIGATPQESLTAPTGTLIIKAGDHIEQFAKQKANFAEGRGFDVDVNNKRVPRTTNEDAARLLEYWTDEGQGIDGLTDSLRWAQFAGRAMLEAGSGDAGDLFVMNPELWTEINRRAIDLESVKARPAEWLGIRWGDLSESVVESIKELPGRVKSAAQFIWPDWLSKVLIIGGSLAGIVVAALMLKRR